MTEFVRVHAKMIIAFVGSVLVGAVAHGLIEGDAGIWVTIVVGAATTVGVYAVPNKQQG